MTSMNCKRMMAVATLATSVVLMGGAAFASPASTTGLAPDPVGQAVATARNTAADSLNQIDGLNGAFTTGNLAPAPIGTAVETARSTVADVRNQIHGLNGAFTTGNLAPAPVGTAVETARSTVADIRNQIHRQHW